MCAVCSFTLYNVCHLSVTEMEVSLECTSNFKPITVNKQLIYFIAEIIQWILR